MCKLLRRIVKLVASMSTRLQNLGGDTSRRCRGTIAVPVHHPSRETIGSSAIVVPEPSLSARGTTYPTSHVRDDSVPSSSKSVSCIPQNSQEQVDVKRDGLEHRKWLTTSTSDRGSIYLREEGGIKMRDKFKPPNGEGRYTCNWNRTDDWRDTPLGTHYPSMKEEEVNIDRSLLAHTKDMEPTTPGTASLQQLFEAQSKELSVLRQEHRAALEENKALAITCASLKQQYTQRSKKLSVARHERQVALARKKEMDDAYATLTRRHEEQTSELDAMRHKHEAALEQKQKAEEDYTVLKQEREADDNEHNTLRNKYHSLRATLEQRTLELQGVQKFLTTADKFSGAEVVNTLRRLNEEVQQSATLVAEWAVENFVFEVPSTDQTADQTRSSVALGMRFMQLLGTGKHKDNPILVEMACRAYLVYELYWIASPWSIGQEEQSHNAYIDEIYQRMRDAEGQAISGNWRALTRAYTLPACISDPGLAQTIDSTIISGLSDILSAAGCTTSKPEITSVLWSEFADRIHHFVSLAGQVNKMIGVGVISEDFEVLVVSPDTAFDEKAMEDSYDNGNRVQGIGEHEETVLCATELGLAERMTVGAGWGQKGKPSEFIVIKPKVALESAISILD